MNINDYQVMAERTASSKDPAQRINYALGLAGGAGEVVDHICTESRVCSLKNIWKNRFDKTYDIIGAEVCK